MIGLADFDDIQIGAEVAVQRWRQEFEPDFVGDVVNANIAALLRMMGPGQQETLRRQDPAMYAKLMQRTGG